jgi:hypothetical protein
MYKAAHKRYITSLIERSKSFHDLSKTTFSLHSNNFTAITHLRHELIQRQTSFMENINRSLPTETNNGREFDWTLDCHAQ